MHVLSVIAVFAISAGILLAAQSGCIGASLAGTDGSYDTPDTELFEHAPVQEVTAWERMTNLSAACQIADTFADMLFTGMLDVAYAVHAVLGLTAVDNITDTPDLGLMAHTASPRSSWALTHTQQSHQMVMMTASRPRHHNPSNITAAGSQLDTPMLALAVHAASHVRVVGRLTYIAFTAYGENAVHILSPSSDGTDPFHIVGIHG